MSPERQPAGLAAFGYTAILLACYVLTSGIALLALPDRPRIALVLSQVFGVLIPALALTAVMRGVIRRPQAQRTSGLALVAVTSTSFVFAVSSWLTWLVWLRSTGWSWVAEFEAVLREAHRALFTVDGAGQAAFILVLVAVLPAVCEEVAFRRGLQGLLATSFPPAVAIGVSSLVFAAAHFDPLGLPTRIFLGVSLGITYHRTGSLLAAGLVHAGYNALVMGTDLVAARLATGRFTTPEALPETDDLSIAPVLLIAGVSLALWWWSLRLLPGREEAAA